MLIAKINDKQINLLPEMSNRHGLIAGSTGCLAGNTVINFNRAKKGFKLTIEKAYKRFNQKDNVSNNWNKKFSTSVRSFNGSTVQLHEIDNIVYSGKKPVYSITLENGLTIEATPCHMIMTAEGWYRVDQLKENISRIMCDTPRATKSKLEKTSLKTVDKEVYGLPLHPFHRVRSSRQSKYPHTPRKTYAVMLHRLIYEAYINDLSLEDFISILKSHPDKIKNLKFTDPTKTHIHHKDFNHYNNDITNLECLSVSEHKKVHSEINKLNFNQGVPCYSEVISIDYVGIKDTYDIICKEPYHNFVANGIVVHNSGKTCTLQVIAEHFSRIGVPVFMPDVKGDLMGIAFEGEATDKIANRLTQMHIENFEFEGNPVRYFDVYETDARSMKTTIAKLSPTLLTRILGLSSVQEGSLYQIFQIMSDYNIALNDIEDLNSTIRYLTENAELFEEKYGKISGQSFGAIQRSMLMLLEGGNDVLFSKEGAFDVTKLLELEGDRGIINILEATQLIQSPKVYAVFLLWLLGELYSILPEAGDLDKPKLIFFYDEAHLLFSDAPKVLIDRIEQLIKLVRSKGVGIFFVTQAPEDIPSSILNQLGNRIIHSMRAYTPVSLKGIRAIAQTMRSDNTLDIEKAITELKVGEALISLLQEDGSPMVTQRALVVPPHSMIGIGE